MDFYRHPMFGWLKDLRREFHRHPETAFEEIETTAKIKETLQALGLELKKLDGLAVGAVGILKGKSGKKVLGLRADIDALPIQELSNVPYKSQYQGRMHACGHDAHTVIMRIRPSSKNHRQGQVCISTCRRNPEGRKGHD